METKNSNTNQYEYKAEMKQLLDLIVHSLYTHPEVFLRELISNASDALNKLRIKKLTDKDIVDTDAELKIKIDLDKDAQTFSIEDTGIGMTREDLINNIGTVARSGTLEYLKTMKDKEKALEEELIGKFGVGFYSVFMVTNEVTIETRNADNGSKAYKWNSAGEGTFRIEESDRKERGTKISFKLKDEYKDFAEENKIKSTINRYSNFADFPIYLGDDKVNMVEALWRKNSGDLKDKELNEFYKFITNDLDDPLEHLQVSVEGAVVSFKALLFIPKNAPYDLFRIHEEKGLNLYSNKILIQNDCKELLPAYLRFVRGVVDTIDLPLNVSREVTQSSPLMVKIRSILTTKILSFFEEMANNDKEKYEVLYKNFGPMIKAGINEDFENRDKLINLFRFETSSRKSGEKISLKKYVSSMKGEQKEIYYISGETRSELEKNPNLEYFRKKEIEVFLLTDPVDVFTVPAIGEFDGKKIRSIDKADLDIMPEDKVETPDSKLSKSLIGIMKDILKGKVEDVVVSKRLVDSPVTLVTGKDGMDKQMEKMMRAMSKGADIPRSKKILEINTEHPLINRLSQRYLANSKDPFIRTCTLQLFDSAMLLEGELESPSGFIKRMTQIMEDAAK